MIPGRISWETVDNRMKKTAWVAVLVFVLDRLTKILSERTQGALTLIPGVLGYRYTQNTGMAFSLLSGKPWLLGLLSVIVLTLGALVIRSYRPDRLTCTACMLILGGALGNMVDRFFTGYVVDMIEFLFVDFAVFNVADAALTAGCVLLGFSLLFRPEAWKKAER